MYLQEGYVGEWKEICSYVYREDYCCVIQEKVFEFQDLYLWDRVIRFVLDFFVQDFWGYVGCSLNFLSFYDRKKM